MTGRLLVALPQVQAGVFERAVILLLQHTDEGSQGVVINRPVRADVDAVLPGWRDLTSIPRTLFQGGPVQTDSALGLATVPGDSEPPLGVRRLFGGLAVVDLDAPPQLLAAEIAGMRIFAGYAGWGPGQLEAEMRRGDWLAVDAEAGDAFTDDPAGLWAGVLRRQPGMLGFLAFYPRDPETN